MTTNQHTVLRQWHMLRMLPRAPRKITVQQICEGLAREEFFVTQRTVQRDLNELSQVFPLVVDDGEKPYGWSWHRDAANFDLPGLAVPEALTLKLVQQHLHNHLPPVVIDTLKHQFKNADKALSAVTAQSGSRSWLNKVRSVQPMQPLIPPELKAELQRIVYEALMQDMQLKLSYRKRDTASATAYESVHPLGIVQRGQIIYLVCQFGDYDDVRTLALHRIQSAELTYQPARKPKGFSLDAFINSGQMGVKTGDPISLKAVFSRKSGEHLFETPICRNQDLQSLEDGSLQLTATIPHTKELVWWLLGFGDGVTVVEPSQLRDELKTTAQRMVALYQ